MTGQAERPLLFLDVDGPLLPFGEDPQRGGRHAMPDSRLTRLSPQLGLRLAALPVVNWPESSEHEREDLWLGLCWKTRILVDWAGGRPFAWVVDEITDADRDWVAANHRGRALLYYVEPFRGLTGKDFAALDQWLRTA